ncbi:MAG: hypothetical protein KAX50_00945 [Saprospiraceae bacterium]|nr:hypothetical protein [Saprospiraceae bacterium]
MDRRKIIMIVTITAVIAGLALLFWKQWKRPVSWNEHYAAGSKDPYGAYVAFQTIKGSTDKKDFKTLSDSLSGKLPADSALNARYIFIGKTMYLSEGSLDALIEFVAAGNNAFISANHLPFALLEEIYPDLCEANNDEDYYYHSGWEGFSYTEDTIVRLNLAHPDLQLEKDVPYRRKYYRRFVKANWAFFEEHHFLCNQEGAMTALGFLNGSLVNYARIPYEKGFFYVHSTPMAFTNYQLLRSQALQYAERAFSHLGTGPVYWDEGSKNPVSQSLATTPPSHSLSSNSPLQFILSQPSLAFAWYLLLLLGILYLLLRSRRRQRIVPVLEPNTNTSLEFVSTIGRLYFLQNDHKQLCLQKMRLFHQFIRERYGLQSRDTDEVFLAKLAAKSEVPREIINKLFLIHNNIQSSNIVTEYTLAQLHGLIEEFHRICK